MRKNPYNKDLIKDHLPLFMLGSKSTSILISSSEQKSIPIEPIKKKYAIKGVPFTMIQPPIVNKNITINSSDILKIEMGETEVTEELFSKVMDTKSTYAGLKYASGQKIPVTDVSWFDCIAFCNHLSELMHFEPCYTMQDIEYFDTRNAIRIRSAEVSWREGKDGFRLPTESEWQMFAKAGTENRWAGCDDRVELYRYAWHGNEWGRPEDVGLLKPNEWGLYDMSGNVGEWCWDEVGVWGMGRLEKHRRYKGGDFSSPAIGRSYEVGLDCKIASNNWTRDPRSGYHKIGFRICRSLDY